jgi:hypothetical protein
MVSHIHIESKRLLLPLMPWCETLINWPLCCHTERMGTFFYFLALLRLKEVLLLTRDSLLVKAEHRRRPLEWHLTQREANCEVFTNCKNWLKSLFYSWISNSWQLVSGCLFLKTKVSLIIYLQQETFKRLSLWPTQYEKSLWKKIDSLSLNTVYKAWPY